MRINRDNFLEQLKKGNEKALEFVVEEYGGLLLSVIRRHLAILPGMQEECMNDVLFKIWRHIGQFDDKKNTFKNWAAGIARYQAIDYLRKYAKELEMKTWREEDQGIQEAGREDEDIVRMIESEISEEVEQMLSCLNETDREIFLKLFYQEKNVDEVSRETGMKKEMIYNRISRGKRKIRTWHESREGR
ncbi:MAG: sigma-70 family RNA polymerase sigma factor [Coprococcus sp.]|nr:sigma-70 family RNA polymerase sigma factor [Coprococcus sp.]